MRQDQTPLYVVVIILAIFMVGGFVLLSIELSNLKNTVGDLQQLTGTRPATGVPAAPSSTLPTSEPISTPPPVSNPTPAAVTIPTAIIFETQSSPALQPQTALTVAVNEVARTADGSVSVSFKVYTNQATGYSAFEPKNAFALIDMGGGSQNPIEAHGTFSPIPQKSMSEGYVTFSADPTRSTIILQVGNGDNPTFYEFNFTQKTYKETAIG